MESSTQDPKSPRHILLDLWQYGPDPIWSSQLLEQIIDEAARRPGGVAELIFALFSLFGEFQTDLSKYVGNFIRDLVIGSFVMRRDSYEAANWKSFAQQISPSITPAQAYLAALAVVPGALSASQSVAILRRLSTTDYWNDAIAVLGADLKTEEGRRLLQVWINEPNSSATRHALDVTALITRKPGAQ